MTGFIIIILVCALASAFFAGSETAYTCANYNHIEEKAKSNIFYGAAKFVLDRFDFALTTGLVGVNAAHFGLSACVTYALYELIVGNFGKSAEEMAALLATVATTVFVLLFCEILPKTYAATNSELVCAVCSLPTVFFMVVFAPVSFLINALIRLIKKPIGDDGDIPLTGDELASAVEQSEEEGAIEEEKSELLQSAIEFPETDIREVIVPRVDMVAFDMNDGMDELISLVRETAHSRIPVYTESIDRITGILYVNLFLSELAEHPDGDFDMSRCVLEPCFIYPSTSLPDALDELRRIKKHIAIVPDEYGGTLGMVTMEDILEELVGDIDDETDEESEQIVPVREDIFEVEGDMSVHDALEELEIEEDDPDTDYTTVAGWVIENLEGFPEVDKSFVYHDLRVTVSEMEEQRITKVRFELL